MIIPYRDPLRTITHTAWTDHTEKINLDLDMDKFFVEHVEDDMFRLIDRPSVQNYPINPEIYYSPSSCPLVSRNDQNMGSCFTGLTIPTASYYFVKQPAQDLYRRYLAVPSLGITRFVDLVDEKIKNNIKRIYGQHDHVMLAFSGGIDSLVLLSYIQSLGGLNKTSLIVFENHSQTHPSCLHLNQHAKWLLQDLINSVAGRCRSVQWKKIYVEDIAHIFNHGDLKDIKCYSTKIVLDHCRDSAVLFGWYGNQVLLHKDFFLDQILLCRPDQRTVLADLLRSGQDFYTQGLKHYDPDKRLIPLHDRFLVPKPWPLMGHHKTRAYGPLADHDIFAMTRAIDFKTVDLSMILDAEIARELIERNCPDLTRYVWQECVAENDTVTEIQIPADLIDTETLGIPKNLRHHDQGLQWLEEEISAIQDRGYLPINSAVSVRALQFIAHTYRGG